MSRIGKRIVLVAQALSACSALVGLLPSVGHAHEIRVSSYEMSEAGGIVVLESDAPIGEPWLRVEAKSLRVWFPNLVEVARFDHQRDSSEPIRSLLLRPGASDSAVVRIDVGSGRKLTRDNVEITRDGLTARIRVGFPIAGHNTVAMPVPSPRLNPPAAASASPAPQPSAAKPLVMQDPSAPVAALPAAMKPSAVTAPKTANVGFAGGSNQNLGLLIMISAALLAVYVCIKRFAKPRSIARQDIEVLSARSLGKGSQLLLVRALGSDHLLMTSNGRVERVASEPSRVDIPLAPREPTLAPPPSAAAAPAAVEESQAEGLGVFTKLSSRSRLRKLLDAVDKEKLEPAAPPLPPSAPTPTYDSRRPHAFGPELLSAMSHHKLTGLSSLPSIANKQSDSVAGIARLRAGTRVN